MRDYLYIWHDPEQQFVVASGIEFKDFLPNLKSRGGIILLDHQSDVGTYDPKTSFEFVPATDLSELISEDIYSWGNFAWADYKSSTFPSVNDQEVAELLFFAHKGRALDGVSIASLSNQFLGYGHDDGWYLRLHYTHWEFIEQLLATVVPVALGHFDLRELKQGNDGFWLQAGTTHREEKTHEIDKVMNRRL